MWITPILLYSQCLLFQAKFVMEARGNSLIGHAVDYPLLTKTTIAPSNPDEMIQEINHVTKQVTTKQVYQRV